MADYEAPAILELGSVADFTQGRGIRGDADSIFFLGHEFSWGHDPAGPTTRSAHSINANEPGRSTAGLVRARLPVGASTGHAVARRLQFEQVVVEPAGGHQAVVGSGSTTCALVEHQHQVGRRGRWRTGATRRSRCGRGHERAAAGRRDRPRRAGRVMPRARRGRTIGVVVEQRPG